MKKFITGILIFILCLLVAGGILVWQCPNLLEDALLSKEQEDLNSYYQVSDEQVAIILNGSLKEEQGILVEDTVYLPYQFVRLNLDSRFYWDGSTDTFIVTDALNIYKTSIKKSEDFYKKDDNLYLSIDFVKTYLEIEDEIFKEPNRIYLNKIEKERKYLTTKSKAKIRTSGGLKSKVISSVSKGEEVELLKSEENWDFVRTSSGHIGYIVSLALDDSTLQTRVTKAEKEEPEYTNISLDQTICLAWQQVTNVSGNSRLKELLKNSQGVNVVSPTWFAVNKDDGSYTSLAQESYVKEAHQMGLQVWALVDDFSKDMSIYNVLSNSEIRLKLVDNLINEVLKVGADGLNVDFEYVTSEAGWHYLEFLRELSVRCRNEGLVLSVDNANPTYVREQYHMSEQGNLVDYVIIMAYDEHWQGSEAGSVASLSYVENGITNALDMVPADKLINGIPFYTRVWKEVPEQDATEGAEIREDGNSEYERYELSSAAYSMDAVQELIDKYKVEPVWDEELGQYYVEIPLDSGKYRIWLEETRSLEEKLKLVEENNIAGIACWKLGLESSDVWPVIAEYIDQ
jgi:spore germination protein YaaH